MLIVADRACAAFVFAHPAALLFPSLSHSPQLSRIICTRFQLTATVSWLTSISNAMDADAPEGPESPAAAPLIRHSRKRRQAAPPTADTQTDAPLSSAALDAESRPEKQLKGADSAAAFAAATATPLPAAAAVNDPFTFDPSRDDAKAAGRRAPTAAKFAFLSDVADSAEIGEEEEAADHDNAKYAQTIDIR